MNKNLLFLSIAACFASFPSYANNIENDLDISATSNTFPEEEYKKKLEEFLMDEEPKKNASKKNQFNDLDPVEKSGMVNAPVANIKEEVKSKSKDIKSKSKDIKEPEINKVISDETNNVNDDNMNIIKMSSLRSEIDSLSILLGNKIDGLREKSANNNESLNELKIEVSEKIDTLSQAFDEKISSKIGQESIDKLNKKLSELEAYIDKDFAGYYSKETVDEKTTEIESVISSIFSNVETLEKELSETVKKSDYEEYKNTVKEEFAILKEELNDSLVSSENKIKGNSLSLKENSDVIKDLRKEFEQRVNDIIGQIKDQKNNFNELLSTFKSNANKEKDTESMKRLLSEKDAVIDEQNKKIEELDKKYNALIEQVAELKNSGLNNNVIKVENLSNLKEAEKKVQEDGGVLILDKNGQLKVLN